MKKIKVAINGFGRIGRCVFRILTQRPNIEIKAINDLGPSDVLFHLTKYDSNYGPLPFDLKLTDKRFLYNQGECLLYQEKDPSKLMWHKHDVDVVIEATGVFKKRKDLQMHLDAGAKKVILTVPAKDELDGTIVLGVNENTLSKSMKLISNASCTTNCLAPVLKILDDHLKLNNALMTTVHAYTNDQRILDLEHSDLRRARSAAINIIPTSTGAAKAVALVMPHLKNKLHGMAVRVPVSVGSLIDVVCHVQNKTDADKVNQYLHFASQSTHKGIVQFSLDPLVSSDIKGNPHSAIVDSKLTYVHDERTVKVIAWYDNEWGYSSRVCDLIERLVF